MLKYNICVCMSVVWLCGSVIAMEEWVDVDLEESAAITVNTKFDDTFAALLQIKEHVDITRIEKIFENSYTLGGHLFVAHLAGYARGFLSSESSFHKQLTLLSMKYLKSGHTNSERLFADAQQRLERKDMALLDSLAEGITQQ